MRQRFTFGAVKGIGIKNNRHKEGIKRGKQTKDKEWPQCIENIKNLFTRWIATAP